METPGRLLKKTREEKGQTLEDISGFLKIRHDYLAALEDEAYSFLPGDVFIKGYLRIYSNALGINADYVLDLYKKQVDAARSLESPPVKTKNTVDYKKYIAISASAAIILLLTVLAVTRKYQESAVTEIRNMTKSLQTQADAPKMFSLEIIAIEETWVSVSTGEDGNDQRLLKPGDTVRWTAQESFSIKVGNAGGIKIIFNGRDIGSLGPSGKVINLVLPESVKTDAGGA
ncbi:MAG: DUF4115 domain-containing protein [Nitrospirae bacterium]|nr:DUF4115 domain-containing protein [Nitrospirota bacterium]